MSAQQKASLFLLVTILSLSIFFHENHSSILSSKLAQRIGQQIWLNECGGKYEGLTTWNEGEEFASLGIGHFIWYPEGTTGPFKEMFPALLNFFKAHGVILPAWLTQVKGCPWHNREEFQQAIQQRELEELRQFLASHVDLQILFMTQRLEKSLSSMLKHSSRKNRSHIKYQFYRLMQTPAGLYALLDYLNFKGEGLVDKECYQGHRWGLLQVLEGLKGKQQGSEAVEEFVEMAKIVLATRVEHAPPERKEQRWIKGWCNRLETYRYFTFEDNF